MAAEEDASGGLWGGEAAKGFDGSAETGLIAGGGAEGVGRGDGPGGKGEIAAEDGEA